MEIKAKIIIVWLLLLSICSCYPDVKDIYGKEIILTSKQYLYCYNGSSKNDSSLFKIFLYTDNKGCISCRLRLQEWNDFLLFLDNLTQGRTTSCFYFFSQHKYVKSLIERSNFSFPIYVDEHDSINVINQLPVDEHFRCFLLDSTNRVILIGNPILYHDVKDLYVKTICERLGIQYNADMVKKEFPETNLGTFSKTETKSATFFISNSDSSEIQIDTIFTSCECTKAQINNTVIKPNDTAILYVIYTPDGIGEFYREVYVKYKGIRKPKTFKIRGKVE